MRSEPEYLELKEAIKICTDAGAVFPPPETDEVKLGRFIRHRDMCQRFF